MAKDHRDDVLSEHLRRIRARRDDVRRVLGGGTALVTPTSEDRRALEREYVVLGGVDRGLSRLLPADWGITGRAEKRFGPAVEAEVLAEARGALAVALVRLQQTDGAADPGLLEAGSLAFDHLERELTRLAADARAAYDTRDDPPVPPAPLSEEAVTERLVAIGAWGNVIGGIGI